MGLGKLMKFLIKKLHVDYYIDLIREENYLELCKSRASFGSNVIINQNTIIWNLANDRDLISIGDSSFIEGELQVFAYGGKITIGKNCYIGRNSKLWSGESIEIGNNVLISHNVGIVDTNAHEVDAFERQERHKEFLKSGHWKTKGSIQTAPIKVCDNAWINFDVIILKGVTIGEGAIIAAGSIVTKSVAPYTMVAGVPAKFIKQLK